MLTKQVFALLALGGELRAWRVFPHPHHYAVALAGQATVEITEDDVIGLLAAKRIVAPPAQEIGDAYGYRIASPEWVRAQALRDFRFGFGCCAVCGLAPVGVTAQGVAARHGHTKDIPEPCAGSGKPLAQLVATTAPTQAAA